MWEKLPLTNSAGRRRRDPQNLDPLERATISEGPSLLHALGPPRVKPVVFRGWVAADDRHALDSAEGGRELLVGDVVHLAAVAVPRPAIGPDRHEVRRIAVEERPLGVETLDDLERVPVLDLDVLQPLRDRGQPLGIVPVIHSGPFVVPAATSESPPVGPHVRSAVLRLPRADVEAKGILKGISG